MTAIDSKKNDATAQFRVEQSGRTLIVHDNGGTANGTYTLTLTLRLADGSPVTGTAKVTVKTTAVKLKLSASKLTLNQTVNETDSVAVTCLTKGYDFTQPVWSVVDGKVAADDKLDINWIDGRLVIAVNTYTEQGKNYKVMVKAAENQSAVNLTVATPAAKSSKITPSIKASGKLDVIRDGSAITITPSYKNCIASTAKTEQIVFLSSADKYTAPVEGLFDVQPDGKGGYLITKAEGAQIDHTLKYKARLIATIGGFTETSKDISISVTMGSAKLTAAAMSDVMFAKDRHDEVIFWFDTTDSTLNGVADVEIKDAKYIPMFDITDCGDGIYAITYKDGIVNPTFSQS